jgi:predicted TIM-barrel fold metal-dependent hydrolase
MSDIAAIRPLSADSHVAEPPDMWVKYIEPKYRDRAPRSMERDGKQYYWLDGHYPIDMTLVACAGRTPKEILNTKLRFEDLEPGGWDPAARLKAQDRDGVAGEMIYPTISMALTVTQDRDLQHACFEAYNRWIGDFVSTAPKRLWAVGQTAVRSVPETVAEVRRMQEQGFKGVYLPAEPWTDEDYDDESFDPLWRACAEMNMPVCFHVFSSRKKAADKSMGGAVRGKHKINMWHTVIGTNQDIIGMFIYGGLFDRHPGLKMVCVEADAGWVPHFAYRMDHIYERHRYWQKAPDLARRPSDYLKENVWFTFQDDLIAFQTAGSMNPRRLLWANDFPHADTTWPDSMKLLEVQTQSLTPEQRRLILRDNLIELFGLTPV